MVSYESTVSSISAKSWNRLRKGTGVAGALAVALWVCFVVVVGVAGDCDTGTRLPFCLWVAGVNGGGWDAVRVGRVRWGSGAAGDWEPVAVLPGERGGNC